MSGFEVVGVVLAVLPLVIEGLEQYRDGLEAIKVMRQYREIIADLILTFETAAARYHRVCESLVAELSFSDVQYADILDHPGGDQWKRDDVVACAGDRLGSSLQTFVRLAQRIHKALLKFATRLELDPANNLQPPWIDKDGTEQTATRQRFFNRSHRIWRSIALGFENGSLNKALKMIEDDIFRLERMLEVGSQPAVAVVTNRRKRADKSWSKARDSAKGLFNSLSKHWNCACRNTHAVSLRLEPRDPQDLSGPTVRFNLLFDFDAGAHVTVKSPWNCRDIDVTSWETDEKPAVMSTGPVPSSKPSITVSYVTLEHSHSKTISTQPSKQSSSQKPQKIQDLCTAMQSKMGLDTCIGMIEDASWQHHLYGARKDQSLLANQPRATLCKYLDCKNPKDAAFPGISGGLAPKQKYRLALILAITVLQLADTPWLNDDWSTDDIHVLDIDPSATASSPNTTTTPKQLQPYLRTNAISPTLSPTPPNPILLTAHPRIFNLGIIFLELAFDRSLSTFKTAADLDASGNDTFYTKHMVASRLLQPLTLLECEKYADATKRCLMGNFFNSTGGNNSLDDPNFQTQFHDGVVRPLREICEVFK